MKKTQDLRPTILITGPKLSGEGGVANFYANVLPELRQIGGRDFAAEYLEIGAGAQRSRLLGPIDDQRRFSDFVKQNHNAVLVHVNPSLNFKCAVRDGLFAWRAKRVGLPVVVFFRGWDPGFERRVNSFFLPFFRSTFLRADAIVVLGSVFEAVIRSWGFEGPVFRATTVVSDDVMAVGQMERTFNPREISLLFLSRLEISKGLLDLLDAVKILCDRKRSVRLTIAGDGVAKEELDSWLDRHPGTAAQVRRVGFVRGQEKLNLLASHDVFVLPTYREGLPNALLEAMASGLAIVTCDVGAIGEVMVEQQNGFFVQRQNPQEIAHTIEKIIDDPSVLAEISHRNIVEAREKFSVQAVSEQLANVYRSIIERSGRQLA